MSGPMFAFSRGLLDGTGGVEAKSLKVEVELGARSCPSLVLPLLDLVLNAGGEDRKPGVDSASITGSSEGSTTSERPPSPLLAGLVSGIASALDVPSVRLSRRAT
jgi:hypothetical protein